MNHVFDVLHISKNVTIAKCPNCYYDKIQWMPISKVDIYKLGYNPKGNLYTTIHTDIIESAKQLEKEIGDDKNKVHYALKSLLKEHKVKKVRGLGIIDRLFLPNYEHYFTLT